MKRIPAAVALLAVLIAPAFSQQISFKLTGGWTTVQGDDYKTAVAGRMSLLRSTFSSVAGEFRPLTNGANFQAEILTHWGKRLAIGFGGGYIPTVFRMHLPQVHLQTVEVDPHVEKLAKQYFSFAVPPVQTLSIDDGRQFLKKSRERYDQIWLDAFNSDYIPAHMTTKEFLQLAKSRLTEGEIVIQSLFCGNNLYDAQIATFQAVFAKVFVFEGQKSGSCIIVASDRPACEPAVLRKQAEKWGGKIGRIDLIAEAGKCRIAPTPKNATILTDDFNPANLLLMQKK